MSIFKFTVKRPELLDSPTFGYPNLHPSARQMLDDVCDYCERSGFSTPVVTEFGRSKEEMAAIYAPTYLQDGHSQAEAEALARARFSWHCVAKFLDGTTGNVRAFDLRDRIYSADERDEIIKAVKQLYPMAEVLDHAVAGGARHFHFGTPDVAGKPIDWL